MAGIGINTSAANQAVANNSSKSNSSLDKDAFLQLLAAQMRYQDPLEPTSNTEYMSQLAQFSTVEQLENLNSTYMTNQSMNLAGKYVILNVPDSSGKISQVSGLVDYVTLRDGKAYFSIKDKYYDAEYLDSVVSLDYLEYIMNNNPNNSDENKNDQTTGSEGDTEGAE